jgi:hypothetical protein
MILSSGFLQSLTAWPTTLSERRVHGLDVEVDRGDRELLPGHLVSVLERVVRDQRALGRLFLRGRVDAEAGARVDLEDPGLALAVQQHVDSDDVEVLARLAPGEGALLEVHEEGLEGLEQLLVEPDDVFFDGLVVVAFAVEGFPVAAEGLLGALVDFGELVGVDEVGAVLVERVVGEVHAFEPVLVLLRRHLVLVGAEAREAFFVDEGDERVDVGDQEVDAQVVLEVVDEQRLADVALDDLLVVGGRVAPDGEQVFGAVDELDAGALAAAVGLGDVDAVFVFLVRGGYLVRALVVFELFGQQESLGEEAALFLGVVELEVFVVDVAELALARQEGDAGDAVDLGERRPPGCAARRPSRACARCRRR